MYTKQNQKTKPTEENGMRGEKDRYRSLPKQNREDTGKRKRENENPDE
jgi:hypothetical protein